MTYAYDPEITPWLEMLPNGPFADFHELRATGEAALRAGLPTYEPEIPISVHDVTVPAFISACQYDPLRDEDIDYAQRLAHADVPTELVLYPGVLHGGLIPESAVGKRVLADMLAALRRGLAAQGS
ncbi:alpha/beta hydrolase [Streptomyces mirabilis]|jgi:acetyl esterase/lipase|uniref:Alpha/beta hydrolase fold n=1 Tax=Streptomyces mirabilis TaxID=68239 RepID=A0A1I2XC30_9ACTN|nr:alpha/beta hydrolase fold domain-containing protein [Streptomyces mirabilis]SFH11035.1 alpha/beta hydrolase fold [Streptomyces mirabilis]